MKKSFLIFISLLLICCTWNPDKAKDLDFANVILYSISDNLKIYNSALNEGVSSELKELIANSIVRQVMMIRFLSPKIEKLNGNSVETLCLVTKSDIWSQYENLLFLNESKEYLNSIYPDVIEQIVEYRRLPSHTNTRIKKEFIPNKPDESPANRINRIAEDCGVRT